MSPTRTSSNTTVESFQMTDGALNAIRTSRHAHNMRTASGTSARSGTEQSLSNSPPRRHNSNNSSDRMPIKPMPRASNHLRVSNNAGASNNNKRESNRSSGTSMWSSFLKNGRRLYGSTNSVGSSITMTDFDFADLSEEFGEQSETSLDVRNFSSGLKDNQPELPERQMSVLQSDSQALLSNSEHTHLANLYNDHSRTLHQQQQATNNSNNHHQANPHHQNNSYNRSKSSDSSPKCPGRKTSVSAHSDSGSQLTANVLMMNDISSATNTTNNSGSTRTSTSTNGLLHLSTNATTGMLNMSLNSSDATTKRVSHASKSHNDNQPKYPNRKKSSKLLDAIILEEDGIDGSGADHNHNNMSHNGGDQEQNGSLEEDVAPVDVANSFRDCLLEANLVGSHEYHGHTYEDSFLGSEAIDAILAKSQTLIQQELAELAQQQKEQQQQEEDKDGNDDNGDHKETDDNNKNQVPPTNGAIPITHTNNSFPRLATRQEALQWCLLLEQELGLLYHVSNHNPNTTTASTTTTTTTTALPCFCDSSSEVYAFSADNVILTFGEEGQYLARPALLSVRQTTDTSLPIQEGQDEDASVHVHPQR